MNLFDLVTSWYASVATSIKSGASERRAVTFIDSKMRDFDTKLKGIKQGTKVVIIDPQNDSLAQIAT